LCTFAATLALTAAPGCGRSGPERFAIGGAVTLDGQPLPDGSIDFTPDESTPGPTVSGIIEFGRYEIPADRGPIAGSYSVSITADRPTGKKVRADILGSATTDQTEQYLPEIYNGKTTLRADINADRDDLDFPLVSQP
jgi:hypothetical protein